MGVLGIGSCFFLFLHLLPQTTPTPGHVYFQQGAGGYSFSIPEEGAGSLFQGEEGENSPPPVLLASSSSVSSSGDEGTLALVGRSETPKPRLPRCSSLRWPYVTAANLHRVPCLPGARGEEETRNFRTGRYAGGGGYSSSGGSGYSSSGGGGRFLPRPLPPVQGNGIYSERPRNFEANYLLPPPPPRGGSGPRPRPGREEDGGGDYSGGWGAPPPPTTTQRPQEEEPSFGGWGQPAPTTTPPPVETQEEVSGWGQPTPAAPPQRGGGWGQPTEHPLQPQTTPPPQNQGWGAGSQPTPGGRRRPNQPTPWRQPSWARQSSWRQTQPVRQDGWGVPPPPPTTTTPAPNKGGWSATEQQSSPGGQGQPAGPHSQQPADSNYGPPPGSDSGYGPHPSPQEQQQQPPPYPTQPESIQGPPPHPNYGPTQSPPPSQGEVFLPQSPGPTPPPPNRGPDLAKELDRYRKLVAVLLRRLHASGSGQVQPPLLPRPISPLAPQGNEGGQSSPEGGQGQGSQVPNGNGESSNNYPPPEQLANDQPPPGLIGPGQGQGGSAPGGPQPQFPILQPQQLERGGGVRQGNGFTPTFQGQRQGQSYGYGAGFGYYRGVGSNSAPTQGQGQNQGGSYPQLYGPPSPPSSYNYWPQWGQQKPRHEGGPDSASAVFEPEPAPQPHPLPDNQNQETLQTSTSGWSQNKPHPPSNQDYYVTPPGGGGGGIRYQHEATTVSIPILPGSSDSGLEPEEEVNAKTTPPALIISVTQSVSNSTGTPSEQPHPPQEESKKEEENEAMENSLVQLLQSMSLDELEKTLLQEGDS